MGKIKGWKKIQEMKGFERWVSFPDSNIMLSVEKVGGWYMIDTYRWELPTDDYNVGSWNHSKSIYNKGTSHFKTKAEARKVAINYMKQHPRG